MDPTRSSRVIDNLHGLARNLRTQLDRQTIFQDIVDRARELLDCSLVGITLRDPDRPILTQVAFSGQEVSKTWPLRHDTLSGQAFHENRTVLDNAYSTHPTAMTELVTQGMRAVVVVPLCEGGRPIGVVGAAHFRSDH